MAHPNKFVSVNLNKSYGKPSNSYASSARSRPVPSSSAGGGGGGMVVLSRPRSSSSSAQKSSAPKLSVPPPLNLPSLRKENEKFDLSSSAGSSGRPRSSGIGSGSASSSVGWTKPAPGFLQEKETPISDRPGGNYMPPAARGATHTVPSSSPSPIAQKAVFLRGEDFPSLKATVTTGASNQKDSLSQNEKVKEDDREKPEFYSPLRMRPQMRSSRLTAGNMAGGSDRSPSHGAEQPQSQQQQQEKYFPGPLPLVKLRHTSDWADDERDTGLSLPERDRDRGFARMDFKRDLEREVDIGSIPPKDFYKGDSFGRRGIDREAEYGGVPSKELYKGDSFGRVDLIGMNKDGQDAASSWKMPLSSQPRVGRVSQKPVGINKEVSKDNNFSHLPYGSNARNELSSGSRDSQYRRRDLGYGAKNQIGRNVAEGFSGKGTEQQTMRGGRYGDLSNNRYRTDTFQNNSVAKNSFSHGNKGLSLNDPILNFGRDKKLNSSSSGKSYLGDTDFDVNDPFTDDPISEVNMKVFKRKKEMQKQDDFHDPVRESFEAELERVQMMQELERKKALEEQMRVMELARREQEERERLAREEEEQRRLIEEEAREAAWQAEQESMEAARRAEEQKIAREEEKRRMLLEEERRKEAARQKLMDLEARIARRQSETKQKDCDVSSAISDERLPGTTKERDPSKVTADDGDWEDCERLMEQLIITASDSSMNRYFDTGSPSRYSSLRDAGRSSTERGKPGNYWKRDTFDNGSSLLLHMQDPEGECRSLKRDTFSSDRGFLRKENYFSHGTASNRPSSRGGIPEHALMPEDFRHLRGSRWNAHGDVDHFARNWDVEAGQFLDSDRFDDVGWGSAHPRGSPNASYAERSFQSSEVHDGFPTYGRSRHSLRQPHVLPPPAISSLRQSQNSFRSAADRPIPSSFFDNQPRFQDGRSEEVRQSGYDDDYDRRVDQPRTPEVLETDAVSSEQKEENDSPRCDSQSSLSVSNPPSSPTQLSHDDSDEADDTQALQASLKEKVSDDEYMVSGLGTEDTDILVTTSSVSQDEDDEWAIENNEEMQEPEEYYEDGAYHEEDDAAHDGGGGGNSGLGQEFDGAPSNAANTNDEILGFDEGVEVSIPISDDLGKASQNFEEAVEVQEDPVGDHSLEVDNNFTEDANRDSSKIVNETEKALQDLDLNPVPSSSGNPADKAEAAGTHKLLVEKPTHSSSLSVPTSTVHPASSTVSASDVQADSPVRLQFGLFTGPSLIPSPVPAIQIGSIQMPLHLHPQLGASITQMQPPQSPFVQFGQLRYPSPLSQGILPLIPQSVSFVRPPASTQYSSTQILGSSVNSQASQSSSSQSNAIDKAPSGRVKEQYNLSEEHTSYKDLNKLQDTSKTEVTSQGQAGIRQDNKQFVWGYQNDRHAVHEVTSRKNYRPIISNRESNVYPGHVPSQLLLGGKPESGGRAPGILSTSRGKRVTYAVRNAGTRSSLSTPENLRPDSSVFQRRSKKNVRETEFRVRENADKRQEGLKPINASQDGMSHLNVRSAASARYGPRKDSGVNKLTKTPIEYLGQSTPQVTGSDGKVTDELTGKEGEVTSKKRAASPEGGHTGGEIGKKNVGSEEDADIPLQSGVVCIFKQAGIEAPSDDDDFIQVRSKRQMLNDRREQREREIKAKSKAIKAPRKHRAAPQSSNVTANSKKAVASLGGNPPNNVRSEPVISGRRGFASAEPSHLFAAKVTSPSLPPIGTPPVKVVKDTRSTNLKYSNASIIPVMVSGPTKFVPSLSFEDNNSALVSASVPLGPWSNRDVNQQVMALTQSQLDDAMKPVRFDTQVATSISNGPSTSSAPIMVVEKPFSPSASPLNSLLAGERIQFGAVTSPTILPPVSTDVQDRIGTPGSSRSGVLKDNLTAANNEHDIFFNKEKHPSESFSQLEDPETEAEAAASAVAVAAISNNDETVGNGVGSCSIPDSKDFSGSDNTELRIPRGGTDGQEVTGQSVAEESLTVALPADLSVETPSLPSWHTLPSPQSTSGPTISHFPGGPHFPMGFDMNPIFGGQVFAFGPHDESGVNQSQQQRSTTLSSGPLGAWPHCHSGLDSFYGSPAGFTGPYISPPGGIPGVQAPPHMLVYNHFAPVGQYGQVGLSFMSTAYIPRGKQPDWKHNPVSSSTVGVGEGDNSNTSVVSSHHNPPGLHSPLQHLTPGSPLMPMASPLAMFDMSPFQPSADLPYQARWSHVPIPPLQSVPLNMPLQQQQQQQKQPTQQVNGGMPSQLNRSVPVGPSSANDRFNDSRSVDGNKSSSAANVGTHQFLNEHLMEPPTTSTGSSQTVWPSSAASNSRGSNGSKATVRNTVSVVTESVNQNAASSFKSQASQQRQQPALSAQQRYLQPIGSGDQQVAAASSHNRRLGYQGRGQGSGSGLDKGFAPPSKMKQIYVAKSPASGPATTG